MIRYTDQVTGIRPEQLAGFFEGWPDHRGQGIGHELLRTMLQRLDGLYMIDLICDARAQPFYQSAGMEPATGMMRRNYERQSGGHPDDAATGGT